MDAAVLRLLHDRGAIRLIDPRWSRPHKFPPIVRAMSIGLSLFAIDANVRIFNTMSCYRLCQKCGAVIGEALLMSDDIENYQEVRYGTD